MKFLASDLDGTLLESKTNSISVENRQAIKKLRDMGHKFIISTGRDLQGVLKSVGQYDDLEYDYLVLCNGALILDKDHNVIYKNSLSNDFVKTVYENFFDKETMGLHLSYENNNAIFYDGDLGEYSYFVGDFKNVNNVELFEKNYEFGLISMFTKDQSVDTIETLKRKILEIHSDKIEAFRNQSFLDIVSKNCSKGEAIKKVLEIEGWNIDNLFTIGDSYNDVSMFNITYNSFTFNHVEEGVKSYANNTVDFVHECIQEMIK